MSVWSLQACTVRPDHALLRLCCTSGCVETHRIRSSICTANTWRKGLHTAHTARIDTQEVHGSALRCGAPGAAKAVTDAPRSRAGAGAGAAQAPSASRQAIASARTTKLACAIAFF